MLSKLPMVLSLFLTSVTFPPPASTSLVAPIVRAMREDGKKSARTFAGPVFVDVSSFVHGLHGLDARVDERVVGAQLNADEKGATKDDAIVCGLRYGHKRCSVAKDGLFISLLSIKADGDIVVATASVEWTERRPSGSYAMGGHILRLTFTQVGGKWSLTKQDILRQS